MHAELRKRLSDCLTRLEGQSDKEYRTKVEETVKVVALVMVDSGITGFNAIEAIVDVFNSELGEGADMSYIVSSAVVAALMERKESSKPREMTLAEVYQQLDSKIMSVILEETKILNDRDDVSELEIKELIDSVLSDIKDRLS